MLNEKQRHTIAERLRDELPNVSEAQQNEIGDLVYTLAAYPVGIDTDFLLDALDPETGEKEPLLTAAKICLQELAKNN